MPSTTISVAVAAVDDITHDVRALTLAPLDATPLPAFSPGSHVIVHVPGERVHKNPYSLACAPWATGTYRIAVRRLDDGRGGSAAIHRDVRVGDLLQIEPPRNLFAPPRFARHHLIVAGGIGITPFLSYVHEFVRDGASFELHYAFRAHDNAALLGELLDLCPGSVHTYADPDGATLLAALHERLAVQPLGTHLSICGPTPMMESVVAASTRHGWPASRVHLERFNLDLGPTEPFAARLGHAGRTIDVDADETLLEALERAGIDVPYLCRHGICGECRIGVLAGVPDHRDDYLSAQERASGTAIMPCVSRCSNAGPLVLDLA